VIPLVAPVESNGPYRHLRVAPLNSSGRSGLRRELRDRRAALSPQQRAAASQAITAHVAATGWLRAGRPVGMYASIGVEVDTTPLRALARRRHCPVYLPCIVDYRRRHMLFARDSGALPSANRLGIPEPEPRDSVAARALAMVLLPILGFDDHGTRLGTGGGYYDRLFSYRRQRQGWHRPLLVGIAFRCQRVPMIAREPHDVPLDAVVTEDGVFVFAVATG
jgi:5-formyltetrahydrofolate cyclo-ligase